MMKIAGVQEEEELQTMEVQEVDMVHGEAMDQEPEDVKIEIIFYDYFQPVGSFDNQNNATLDPIGCYF